MFKKPLFNLKTSATLRSSDRRKLKQKIIQSYGISPEDGDLIVPEGLLSVKVLTHLEEHGIAYLSPDGNDPLWFSIGKGSDDLIPTVYTLWKKPTLLPILSTPPEVIPILIGGADLMIPGVVQQSPSMPKDQLVAITQHLNDPSKQGAPLAVGRMALDGSGIVEGAKGKAVLVLHTWKDYLWAMGKGGDVPNPTDIALPEYFTERGTSEGPAAPPSDKDILEEPKQTITPEINSAQNPPKATSDTSADSQIQEKYSPPEVTSFLRMSLIQAIETSLSGLPQSSFPMSSSILYSTYILPARPAFLLGHSHIDIKHSTYKSVTAFLKSAEKDGLLTLKASKAKSGGDSLVVTAVHPNHPDVLGHKTYRTIGDVEAKRIKKAEREEIERNKVKEMIVTEMWKAVAPGTINFFEACGRSPTALHTAQDVKAALQSYIADKQLVSMQDQQYINIDDVLLAAMQLTEVADTALMKRDELMRGITTRMQDWYEITVEGKDPVLNKGTLKPISVVVKSRQGRRAATLITGFEPFFLNAEDLAEELRKSCASATSVSPVTGKAASLEVLVQGKQIKAVADLLISKGVPKKWIETKDLVGKK